MPLKFEQVERRENLLSEERRMILHETLKSLCHESRWCYAVFWRLKRRSRMMLTWEDGYYEFAKPSLAKGSFCIKSLFNEFETGGTLDREVFGQEACSKEDKIGLAVAKMSYQVYSLGEGIVGHVAFTGKHQWVVRERNYIDKSNSISMLTSQMLEYPAEWQNQFEYGIKTIAVVAVTPHGVVQLGSMQMIKEDLEFISHIRTVFETLQTVPGAFLVDSLQEPLNGKMQGSIFPTVSASPTAGTSYQVQRSTPHTLQGNYDASTLKYPNPNVLDQFGGTCGFNENSQNNEAKPTTVPSRSISSPAEISSQQSKSQQRHENINTFTSSIIIGHGGKVGRAGILSTGTRDVSPFQGMTGADMSVGGNHYAILAGLGVRSNSTGLMEQHMQKETDLKGHFQLPCTFTALQSQSVNGMLAATRETSSLNSNVDEVELNNNKKVFQITGGELLGDTMFASGSCNLDVLQQKTPAAALHYASGQSESSALQYPYANQPRGLDLSPVSKIELNVDTVYNGPTVLSECIETCAFDSGQPLWSLTTGHLGMGPLELLNNGLPHGLLMSEPVGIEEQPWDEEIRQKFMAGLLEECLVEKMDCLDQSSKDLASSIQNLPSLRDNHSGPSGDIPNDHNNIPKSHVREQENMLDGVSSFSEFEESFQTFGSVLTKETGRDACDEKSLLRRNKYELNIPQGFGISSSSTCHSDVTQSISLHVHTDIEEHLLYETKSEHLLDAVVGNLCSRANPCTDDNVSSKTTSSVLSGTGPLCGSSVRTDTYTKGQVCGLEQTQAIFAGLSQCTVDKGNLHNLSYNCFKPLLIKPGHLIVEELIDESPSVTHLNSWFNDGQSLKCEKSVRIPAKKSESTLKVKRKRARPGESGRPRPKDRQQIQDRVKELREIVPNGTKCSIDSLLERTIKHMVFLQSVTKHPENLKQSNEEKVLDKDDNMCEGDDLKVGSGWALELSGQTMGCPIVVENLSQPRQMLVQMLCEEQGLFLEIADIFQGLGLTILKGIMEAHNKKIWAHFIVEANRDVHRVEILFSLVQLLQPNSNGKLKQSQFTQVSGF